MSSISKSAADRQKRVLTELLALPGNNVCADCQSPAPRWASWNLGIFLCVQCATAHRKLGSHISKVKSVTLDTWTKEQVESVRNMGNTKANELYNPDPLRNPPPTNMEGGERDSELETYIRNKYQYKAFMKREPAKAKSSSSSLLGSGAPSSSSTSRRPPDTNRVPPLKVGTVPNPGPNMREAIDAVSPSASSFLSEMQNHTRELQMGNRDRARSTPPNAAVAKSGGRPSTATDGNKGFEFTSVGVTPAGPSSAGRPSTATGGLGSARVPSITTTPPASSAAAKGRSVTMGGGFSWGSGPSASTGAAASSAVSAVPSATQPATVAASTATPSTSAPTTTTAPPPPPPQRELSLFEQDLMSLQMGITNPAPSNPPLAPSLPATNPFPMGYANGASGPLSTSPPPFMNGMTTTQSPFGANTFSPATSPFTGSLAGAMPGGMNNVQSLTTGFASMTMGGTGLGPSNPFGAQSPSQGFGASPSPFGSIPPQPTGGMSFTHTNPFGAMQSPPTMTSPPFGQMQPTGATYQPSSSPFQPSASPFQPSSSPFQPSPSPFQPSPSPFQAGMLQTQQPTGFSTSPFGGGGAPPSAFQPSPFQTQPTLGSFQSTNSSFQQQPQFTGMSQASTFSNASAGSAGGGAGFAAFAQGMLPQAPGQQQQVMGQGSFNPFLQQQQQQQRSGTMGWMG